MTLAAVPSAIPNVNLGRARRPRLSKALRFIETRSWRGAELERDIVQATGELYPVRGEMTTGIHLPSSIESYHAVLEELAVRTEGSEAARYAVRAIGEGTSSITSVTSAGALAGFQTLSDNFALALTSNVVLKRMPDVEVLVVQTKSGTLPRETAIATTSATAEGATLTSTDPTIGGLSWALTKMLAFRTLSNEFQADLVSIDTYLNRTISRDVGLLQDQQLLEGSGAGVNVTGIRNTAGLTTSSWVAPANGATPTSDDLIKMVFDIYGANANPTAWIMAPRTLQRIAGLKDSAGLPVFIGGGLFSDRSAAGQMTYPRCAGLLLGLPVYVTTTIPTTETQGAATTATHIVIGDFTFAKILERGSVEIFQSRDVGFAVDTTPIRAAIRSTLVLSQPLAFSVPTGIL